MLLGSSGGFCGLSGGVLLFLYILVYLLLTCILALVLGNVSFFHVANLSGRAQLAALTLLRFRGLWLVLLFSLAGLPPALFFGPKLGLLALFLTSGAQHYALCLILGVFCGWVVYYNLGQRALVTSTYSTDRPLRSWHVSTFFSWTCVSLLIFLVLGFGVLDEIFALVVWLS